MLNKTIAIAAVLLAGGAGAALGQTNPATATGTTTVKRAEAQGGSKEIDPDTHKLTALRARKQPQKQSPTTPTTTQRLPRQTLDAGAGR